MEDLLTMLKPALEKAEKGFSGDLASDRKAVRDSIAGITNFTGLASDQSASVLLVRLSVEMVTEHLL